MTWPFFFVSQSIPVEEGDPLTDPDFASVSLLHHFDGSDGGTIFTDHSANGYSTPGIGGNAQTSTTNPKFGTACLLLDGSGDWIVHSHDTPLDLSTGAPDWTLEAYGILTALPAAGHRRPIFEKDGLFSGATRVSYELSIDENDKLTLGLSDADTGTGQQFIRSPSAVGATDGSYHHMAAVRSGGNALLFWDGVLLSTTAITATMVDAGRQLLIGKRQVTSNTNSNWIGRVEDIRITKGVARYTGNFTPRVTAFPNSA